MRRIAPNIKLKIALWERGVRQRNLAFGIDVDESRISRIINGYEKPTPEIKGVISEYLNLSPSECGF
jgi:plasmid maintenance system antidote protein VapI